MKVYQAAGCWMLLTDHLLVMLRELVITTLGVSGDKSVMEDAHSAFVEQTAGRRAISSDLCKPVSISNNSRLSSLFFSFLYSFLLVPVLAVFFSFL